MNFKKMLLGLCLVPLALCSCTNEKKTTPSPTPSEPSGDVTPPVVVLPTEPDEGEENGSSSNTNTPSVDETLEDFKVIYYNEDGTVANVVDVKEKTTYVPDMSITSSKAGDDVVTYDFIGWSTSKDDVEPKESIYITKDIKLYPVYNVHATYVYVDIVYKDGLIESEIRKLNYGAEFNPEEETLPETIDKFGFWGWFKDGNYTEEITETIVIKDDMTIYADVTPYEIVKSETLYYSSDGVTFSTDIPETRNKYSLTENIIYKTDGSGYYELIDTVEDPVSITVDKYEGSSWTLTEIVEDHQSRNLGDIYLNAPTNIKTGCYTILNTVLTNIEIIGYAVYGYSTGSGVETRYYIAFNIKNFGNYMLVTNTGDENEIKNNFSDYCEQFKKDLKEYSFLTKDGYYVLDVNKIRKLTSNITYEAVAGETFDFYTYSKDNTYTSYELTSNELYYFVYNYYENKDTREE